MKVVCVVFTLISIGCLACPTCPTYKTDLNFDVTAAGKCGWYLTAYSVSGPNMFPLYSSCGLFYINCGCYDTPGFQYYVEKELILQGKLVEIVPSSYKLSWWQELPEKAIDLNMEILYYTETLTIVALHNEWGRYSSESSECSGSSGSSEYYVSVLVLTSVEGFQVTPSYLAIITEIVSPLGLCYSQFTIVSQSCCSY